MSAENGSCFGFCGCEKVFPGSELRVCRRVMIRPKGATLPPDPYNPTTYKHRVRNPVTGERTYMFVPATLWMQG